MDKIVILGGGTFSHVRSHLALAAPAFGTTARKLAILCEEQFMTMKIELALTKMANAENNQYFSSDVDSNTLVTNEDVKNYIVNTVLPDPLVKIIFFSAAMCDFEGFITEPPKLKAASGKYSPRLSSKHNYSMQLTPTDKVISLIHKTRPDIFVVGFKTTDDKDDVYQRVAGQGLLSRGCNLVVVNDVVRRTGAIVADHFFRKENNRNNLLKLLVFTTCWITGHDEDDINTEPSPNKRWLGPDDYLLPRKTPKEGLNRI